MKLSWYFKLLENVLWVGYENTMKKEVLFLIESYRLQKTFKGHQVQLLPQKGEVHHKIMSLRLQRLWRVVVSLLILTNGYIYICSLVIRKVPNEDIKHLTQMKYFNM